MFLSGISVQTIACISCISCLIANVLTVCLLPHGLHHLSI